MKAMEKERKVATRIIEKYSLTPPVDIYKIVKHYARCIEDNLPNNVDAICIMDTKPLIVLEKVQSINRKRFSLAHELGHLTIPWHYGMISCHTDADTDEEIDEFDYRKMEREANNFAAELLMPSSWIDQVISNNESKGLDEILSIITEEAEVSQSAAFFSLFPHLPSGYVAYINNFEFNYGKMIQSQGTKVFVPAYRTDFEWLDYFATEKGYYNMDKFEVGWWKIQNDLSEIKLNELVKKEDEFLSLKKIQSFFSKGTLPSVLHSLIELLPSGYVLIIAKNGYQRYFLSPSTNIRIHSLRTKDEIFDWFKSFAQQYENFTTLGYDFWWGKITIELPLVNVSSDKRLSKNILRNIINETIEEQDRIKYTQKINGVVGALNNEAPRDFKEFYRMFRERFIGVKDYELIYKHPDFENFIINKINEILNKK